eukprot:8204894-Alexandrium_andersonii.AAC.1
MKETARQLLRESLHPPESLPEAAQPRARVDRRKCRIRHPRNRRRHWMTRKPPPPRLGPPPWDAA